MSIEYEGKVVPRAYIIDLVVENKLLIEIKSVAAIFDTFDLRHLRPSTPSTFALFAVPPKPA